MDETCHNNPLMSYWANPLSLFISVSSPLMNSDETKPRGRRLHAVLRLKINSNLPILGIYKELSGIMVNKGQIHRELRYFRDIFWNLVKLDDELR